MLATVLVPASLVLPTRYREDGGLALAGEAGGAAGVVALAGTGMHLVGTAGGERTNVFLRR